MKFLSNYFWLVVAGMVLPVLSFAEAAAGTAPAGPSPWIAPGAGIAMGLAVLGGGLGQGRIAAAFMEGVSRNPSAANVTRTPLILSLVFVETLVLFTVLIALMLVGKMV